MTELIAKYIPAEAIPNSKMWLKRWVAVVQVAVPARILQYTSTLSRVPVVIRDIRPYAHRYEDVETVKVYDFTVDAHHNYLAGGVLVSNSMEQKSLLSHGANAVIKDLKLIKGQRNDDLWRQIRLGGTPEMPKTPLVYEKFKDYIRAAGVNLREGPAGDHIFAMTSKQAKELTGSREIKNSTTFSTSTYKPLPGGLFDPEATGSDTDGNRWGYIQLPEPLPNPVMEDSLRSILGMTKQQFEDVIAEPGGSKKLKDLLSRIDVRREMNAAMETIRSGAKSKRDAAVKRWGYLNGMLKNETRPEDFLMERIPVLPPRFRPITIGDTTMVADPNKLYKALLDNIADYKESNALPESMRTDLRRTLYKDYRALVGTADPVQPDLQNQRVEGILSQLFGKGSPKVGFTQRRVIGTNTDMTGLSVITPNPALRLDQVGLPETYAWDLYEPFIVRHMVRAGVPATVAVRAVEARNPQAYAALQTVVKERPVIINRAPTMHKYSMLAMEPVLTKGKTLQIPPGIISPMGADYDGDDQIATVIVLVEKRSNVLQTLRQGVDVMSVKFKTAVPVSGDSEMFAVDLEKFPRIESSRKELMGTNGPIYTYDIPEGVKILGYKDGALSWEIPVQFSVHPDRVVEIVNLSNKYQIITDNDPRAVFGIGAQSMSLTRCTPTDAVADKMMVPRSVHTPECVEAPYVFTPGRLAGTIGINLREIEIDEDIAYCFGVFLGNGWCSGRSVETPSQINICGNDIDVLQGFEQGLFKLFEPGKVPARTEHQFLAAANVNRHGDVIRWTYASAVAAEKFRELFGHTAHGKKIPGRFQQLPRDLRIALFGGFMDTDGSIAVSNAKGKPQLMAGYTSVNLSLIRAVAVLARSIGIRCRISGFKYRGNQAWQLTFSNIDIQRWGGAGMRCARKLEKMKGVIPSAKACSAIRMDLVPFPYPISSWFAAEILPYAKQHTGLYSAVRKAVNSNGIARDTAIRLLELLCLPDTEDFRAWRRIIADTSTTWERVLNVEYTEITETGYDLSVPGTETFANFDGVILSNTMSYSVPVSEEAVREAREKMSPARNLLSARNDKPVFDLKEEILHGLYFATRDPDPKEPVQTFKTRDDAVKAYRQGLIKLHSPIRILDEN